MALAGIPIYAWIVAPVVITDRLSATAEAMTGYAVSWLLSVAVLLLVLVGERLPLRSIGLRRLSLRDGLLAVAAGVLLSLLVPVLTVATNSLLGADGTNEIVDLGSTTATGLLAFGVVTAAFTEEVLFRGYAIERLEALTGRRWLAGIISLAFFVSVHLATWSPAHVFGVVLPLGAALTGLYLWKRSLPVVIVAHLLADAPLIVLAIAG